MKSNYAIIRGVPLSYDQCVTTQHDKINVALARRQHAAYCYALEKAGAKLIVIAADERLPDCCFVEDTVIVVDDLAIITRPGAPSRRPEVKAVEEVMLKHKTVRRIVTPGTLDGGDVLRIGTKIFIGLSGRTTQQAIDQVKEIISPMGVEVIAVPVHDTLHLKSVITALNETHVVMSAGHFDESLFSDYQQIVLPMEEAYAANCLSVNETVFVPTGYPATRAMIEAEGFSVVDLENSEFKKGDGALTCLSILF